MSIAGISSSRGNNIKLNKSSYDSYENNIKKQITALEEKMKTISNDEEKPAEEKKKEKQAAQEQLQNLNQELKEYQIQKRQEETAKKQEALKEALASANEQEEDTFFEGLSGKEAGVMITLSNTKEQIAGMVRVRKNLEGKQRTASSEEEKADLQKKINRVSKGIGQKLTTATDAISDFQKTNTDEDKKKQPKAEPKKEEVFWADTKPISAKNSAISSKPSNSGKAKLFNDNISYVIK